MQWFLPDVRLRAAVSGQLVLGEVGVVRGRDEVVSQRPSHVLVNSGVVRVESAVLLRQHVHGESVGGHELVLLGCTGQKEQKQVKKEGRATLNCQTVKSVQCVAGTGFVDVMYKNISAAKQHFAAEIHIQESCRLDS